MKSIFLSYVAFWFASGSLFGCQKSKYHEFEKVDAVIEAAIADGAFPSAVVGVLRENKILFHKAYGKLTYEKNSPKTTLSTIYDLASLTKALATTLSLMKLYEEGQFRLTDKVSRYLPELKGNHKEEITIRNLLLHNAGFVPFRPFIRTCFSPDDVMRAIYQDSLCYPTGTKTIYSDIDFILLGELVHRLSGKPLDEYFHENFAKPLGLESTFFLPPDSLRYRIAPTEIDTTWHLPRARPLVHDPNAALLGGVAGHAGLFSTSGDILRLMSMVMNGGKFNGKEILKPEIVWLFTKRDTVLRQRALGWDMKSPGAHSSAGKYFSLATFGHLGFTGTSVWVDPARSLCVVFLTNRVYPSASNKRIRAIRPKLHDAVIESIEPNAQPDTSFAAPDTSHAASQ
nr:serine hydrolase domain-containing protein [Chloroherpeton thalassium]